MAKVELIVRTITNEKNQWLTFIINKHEVVEVHSTGQVIHALEDDQEVKGADLFEVLERKAMRNELYSQNYGKSGIRWEEEND